MVNLLPPIITHYDKRRQHVCKSVRYNKTGQRLDIWRPQHVNHAGGAPVMLFVPGGAWMLGHRRGQSHQLMAHLVDQGWVCVAIDYRTAPFNRWPAPFVDVRTAMRWVRKYIGHFGGNPDFVTIAGASAGGHMASLLGLAENGRLRPDAVVSFYGVYDWQFRGSLYHEGLLRLLEHVIVGKSQRKHPEIFRDASPIAHIHEGAPPFLIIHGTGDWLTPVQGARRFSRKLAAVSEEDVVYREIPGAVHAFDLVSPPQAKEAIDLVDSFLDGVRLRDRRGLAVAS